MSPQPRNLLPTTVKHQRPLQSTRSKEMMAAAELRLREETEMVFDPSFCQLIKTVQSVTYVTLCEFPTETTPTTSTNPNLLLEGLKKNK